MEPSKTPSYPEPPKDEEHYAHYLKIGKELQLSGSALQRFVEARAKEYETKWSEHKELEKQKVETTLLEKQIHLAELQKGEKELDQATIIATKDVKEKERLHQIEIKKLEVEQKEKERQRMLEVERKREEDRNRQRIHEMELEERKLALQLQLEDRKQAQREAEELSKERQRQHELRMQELKVQVADKDRDQKRDLAERKQLPKMPMFREDRDDIDAFLSHYERMAKENGWKEEKWALYLGNYLDGGAKTLYDGLISDESVSFEDVKAELMFKFKCDAEGFHERFRNGKPLPDESYRSYYRRLTHLFNRWTELLDIPKTFEGLYDFMITEQMLAGSCRDLQIYLKEKCVKSSKEICDFVIGYRSAHPGKELAKSGPITLAGKGPPEKTLGNAAFSSDCPGRGQYHPNRGVGRGFGRGRGGSSQYQSNPHSSSGSQQSPNTQIFKQNESQKKDQKQDQKADIKKCTFCQRKNHWRKDCWFLKDKENGSVATTLTLASACSENVPTAQGKINDLPATIMRDTGASIAGVRKSYVNPDQILSDEITVQLFDGSFKTFPTALVKVESPFFIGEVKCCIIETPPFDLILGNVEGTKSGDLILANSPIGCVNTRAQLKAESNTVKPLKLPTTPELGVTKSELVELQKTDKSLQDCWKLANNTDRDTSHPHRFVIEDEILCRKYQEKKRDPTLQILVPKKLRQPLLEMAHECLLAGHGGRKRTTDRLYTNFFWPGIHEDIKDFCKSCHRCQMTAPRIPNVPLDFMPCISEPFSRLAIDITGPFKPPSQEGHSFILSVVDVGTRYPEAVAMKKIDTVSVAEELLKICARMGFPREILSDNGSQFTSQMFKEFCRLLSIQQVHSSPYHAQSNGIVERFHATIKPMLRKLIDSQPRNWHRYLPALLYACRDVPNASTGFSPFELLFGRRPRGPLDLIAEAWRDKADDAQISAFQYICDLKNFFEETSKIVEENMNTSATINKKYKDRGARARKFKVNDEVLLLLPDNNNKLLMGWKGPFKVTECRGNDYIIDINGNLKVFHANILKKYFRRQKEDTEKFKPSSETKESSSASLEKKIDNKELVGPNYTPEEAIICIASVFIPEEEEENSGISTITSKEESLEDATIDGKLSKRMHDQMMKVLSKPQTLYKADPGEFKGELAHAIPLTTEHPVRRKQYPLPFSSKEILRKEIEYMERVGVIEKSTSPFCSPVVLVSKKDSSTRVCIDFRELNKVTIFDAEPIPDIEELFIKLSNKRYFTKVDLSKGFYQIPVREEDRHKTAFQTPQGLFQFRRMPFGLVTAPATFARMMRMLELESCGSINFFDDILTASETWEEHLRDVNNMLERLHEYGLTVRPSKIHAGFQELEFLGHLVGGGKIKPEKKKIEKILSIPKPSSKKQIRSIMGLLGYYRRYIPAYSIITAPITNQLQGNKKTVDWTPECQEALNQIQRILSEKPVLILPELRKTFTVRTDASNTGIAGVLLQELDERLHPVAYVSRKLLDRETRYSTIEKECLAIVWTLQKLDRYLWGQKFILQTDHKPLTFLKSAMFKNNRILGWSLAMQGYSFEVREIAGKDNILADLLSRSGTNQSLP